MRLAQQEGTQIGAAARRPENTVAAASVAARPRAIDGGLQRQAAVTVPDDLAQQALDSRVAVAAAAVGRAARDRGNPNR